MHRKIRNRVIACILTLLTVVITGCDDSHGVLFPKDPNTYSMDLCLDARGKTLTGTVTVDYISPSPDPLNEIPFMVYPNAYQRESTAPFYAEDFSSAYPDGFSPGGITILSASVNGDPVSFTLSNPDETLLTLSLPTPLMPGKAATVVFTIKVDLPHSVGRFGYGENTVNLCNFFPIACVMGEEGFYTYPYYKAGDPFISHNAAYDVRITVPKGYTLAHTGEAYKTEHDSPAGYDTHCIHAENVRDFAMVLSHRFDVATEQVDDVTISSYYYPGCETTGKAALGYAKTAMAFLKSHGMEYPYPTLCVVQADFFIGGMEYPGLMLIDGSLYRGGINSTLEEVVAHETIHQYFYGAVGNDEVKEPWVDEAVTAYLTLKYFGFAYDHAQEENIRRYHVEGLLSAAQDLPGIDPKALRVGTPMCDFSSSLEYSLAVYTNGARMFYELEDTLGEELLLSAFADYYHAYSGAIATGKCLMESMNRSTQMNLNGIFKKWL